MWHDEVERAVGGAGAGARKREGQDGFEGEGGEMGFQFWWLGFVEVVMVLSSGLRVLRWWGFFGRGGSWWICCHVCFRSCWIRCARRLRAERTLHLELTIESCFLEPQS